jgi:tetratricopeptide (TPR) repeat protein
VVLSDDERMSRCERLQQVASAYFDEGQYALARNYYDEAIIYLDYCEDEGPRHEAARTRAQLNLAACCVHTMEYRRALRCADDVLSREPATAKALYRRAQARVGLGLLK